MTVSASLDEGCMLAVWLVGTEQFDARDSGEVCLFEIDADAVGDGATRARLGIKAHHDDRLRTEMIEGACRVSASRPHTRTAIWGRGGTVIGCEGVVVAAFAQAPSYPLALMLDLFEIGPPSADASAYPKTARIHRVKGWDLTASAATG